MITQPLGRVVALQFRNIAMRPGGHPTTPVLRVHLRVPDGSYHHHDLVNGDWALNNEALQFLALHGYRPSNIGGADSTIRNCMDDNLVIPVAPTDHAWHDQSWGIARTAMQGGQEALQEAEWFDATDGTRDDEESADAAVSGSEPDPGTGNRGGVEEPSDDGVSAELADEDSDAGIEVTVE
jgi:hypothetical protein